MVATRTPVRNHGVTRGMHREGRVARQVEGARQSREDICPPPDVPLPFARAYRAGAGQRHERELLVAALEPSFVAGAQRLDGERQVPPASRAGIHSAPVAATKQQLAHTSAAWSSSSRGIASEQAICPATIAPEMFPRRTPSARPRPCTIA